MTSFAGLDSETWSEVRDILIQEKVITESDKGHYLLSRDLHTIPFWQLKEWIDDEHSLIRTRLRYPQWLAERGFAPTRQ